MSVVKWIELVFRLLGLDGFVIFQYNCEVFPEKKKKKKMMMMIFRIVDEDGERGSFGQYLAGG